MKKKFIIGILLIFICVQRAVFAETIPQAIQEAGSINSQNADKLKDFEKEMQFNKDFEQFEKNKNIEQKDKELQKQKPKKNVQKAKLEEYATKGVYIENIEVSSSEILTENEIKNIINNYIGNNLKIEDIRNIVNDINKLYLEKGYVTARAYLPEQTIENGKIKIYLAEGKVGDLNINNPAKLHWTKDKYIKDRINAKSGTIFNIAELERDILLFNRYNDGVTLSANLNKGTKDLTTDINLISKETSPFHLHFITDNQGRETIGVNRFGVMLQDDSLTGHRDKLTFGTYLSKSSVTPFFDYNLPINKKDGRVGFMYSYSKSDIKSGPFNIFNIGSRSHNFSLYYSQPIIRKTYMELTSVSSLSYKHAITSIEDIDLNTDKIPGVQTGLNFRYDTKRGIWYANQNIYYAFPEFKTNDSYLKLEGGIVRMHDFGHGIIGQLRTSYQVIPNKQVVPYVDQIIAGGMNTVRGYSEGLLIGRSGYIASGELIFPILPSTIKIKDKSTIKQNTEIDINSINNTKPVTFNKEKEIPFLGKYVKGAVFIDHAGIFPYKGTGVGTESINSSDFLLSTGLGLRIQFPGDVSARFYWGIPLMTNRNAQYNRNGRFHFEITISPSIDKILALRKPKEKL